MRHLHIGTIAALAVACCVFAGPASADQFPVTGNVTMSGGAASSVPSGVTFGDSTYNANNGDLSSGKFSFPESTTTFDGGLGVVTYQFSQTNTSMVLVGSDGMAILTPATMSLKVVSASYFGQPISVGNTCVFGPISWNNLWGARTAAGLDLMQASFAVPAAQANSCGTFTSAINDSLQGNNNSIELVIGGNFALPAAGTSDLIFINGFGL